MKIKNPYFKSSQEKEFENVAEKIDNFMKLNPDMEFIEKSDIEKIDGLIISKIDLNIEGHMDCLCNLTKAEFIRDEKSVTEIDIEKETK